MEITVSQMADIVGQASKQTQRHVGPLSKQQVEQLSELYIQWLMDMGVRLIDDQPHRVPVIARYVEEPFPADSPILCSVSDCPNLARWRYEGDSIAVNRCDNHRFQIGEELR